MKLPESFLELLGLNVEKYPVIAVVGGGGKTSLIYRLKDELLEQGKKVLIATTTHMAYDPSIPFARGGDEELTKRFLDQYGYAIAADLEEEKQKFSSISEERLRELTKLSDVTLIEADGSRQLPVKIPEEWEPAIPAFADIVISVVGLDCLGKPICETAHRMERTARFLKKSMDAPITEADVVKIASSICGLFKNVEDRVYRVYLNKADVLFDLTPAMDIVERLEQEGKVAAYGSLGHRPS